MNELGPAMRDVTEEVDVRAGFVGDVLRGGRRRQTRRRRGLAVAMAAVVGLIGFGAGVVARTEPPRTEPQDLRLLEATKGRLAGDQAALLAATEVWRVSLTSSWRQERGVTEVRGKPHVYWADATPDGDAAVVMQEAKTGDRWRTMVGLIAVDPADGARKLVGSTNPRDPDGLGESFQFGKLDRTFLVLERPTPVYLSPGVTRDAEGRVERLWALLDMREGVSVWTAPEGTEVQGVRLVSDSSPPARDITADRLLTTRPASSYLRYGINARRTGANWSEPMTGANISPNMRLFVGAGGDERLPDIDWVGSLRHARMIDIAAESRAGSWRITAQLPDSRRAVLGEYQDSGPWGTLYAVLLRADGTLDRVVRGSVQDQPERLVKLRLPDQQGWIVGDMWKGIRYRTSTTGEWQGDYTSAALLPDEAVQIEVVRKGTGSRPEVVDLTR